MITQDQLKDIATRIEKLKSYLEIDKKLIEIANEEEKTANPDFWNNPKEAEVLMKELRFKKKWVENYRKVITLNEDIIVLYEFYKEGEVEENEIEEQFEKVSTFLEDLEFKNMLSEEGDSLSATIQITAGAGGTESAQQWHFRSGLDESGGNKANGTPHSCCKSTFFTFNGSHRFALVFEKARNQCH